ncbi:helix-turn-helix domain-containing protein [Streptomonospora sp. S1-112]|uniref:Helix-turn-helix domain-containing protein n=1 Tax=Streptomonospora mangrovi TaxID=2883123 RepID=A0A9X3NN82_9ACTN|nr:helix-turn-helix transcriptional regulator [Streptomonospora mangrovi]MDA0563645.1 helix-turn-helix domain-containing protein [Streptomonospora mangrovi]
MIMQQHPRSPSLRRRRLSAELRRARIEVPLTAVQAARELGWAVGKLSMIENAETKSVKPADLDKLLDLYKVDDAEKRGALHQLARDAKERGWWAKYKDVFRNETLPDFEAEASNLRTYEAQVIPGLLQIPEYTEAIFHGARYANQEEVKRQVDARMARRDILTRFDPVHLRAVIDEAAFHRLIGGKEVMLQQLRYLLHMAQMPHIDVQVLPFSKGAHAGLTAPFVIMSFPSPLDPTIVCVPTLTDALYLEEPDVVESYSATFGDIQGSASSSSESAAFIKAHIDHLESN